MVVEGKDAYYRGFDLTPYFATGYEVSTSHVYGKNAMTTMDGFDFKDEVADRTKVVFTCLPLNEDDLAELMRNVLPHPVGGLYFFDPDIGDYRTMKSNRTIGKRKYRGVGADGNLYWTGLTLTFEGLAAYEVSG